MSKADLLQINTGLNIKSFPSKTEVSNEADLNDKNRKKLNKIQTFDSISFLGRNQFDDDGMQSYLVFQPVFKSFKTSANSDKAIAWKSNSLSEKLLNLLLHQIIVFIQ